MWRASSTPTPATAARWLLRPATEDHRPGATVARALEAPGRSASTDQLDRGADTDSARGAGMLEIGDEEGSSATRRPPGSRRPLRRA